MYQKWHERQFQEMYKAFEEGRSEMDPSFYWYKSELMFLEEQIIPHCQKMQAAGVFGASADECLAFAITNRDQWSAKGVNLISTMKDRYHGKLEEKARADRIAQRHSLGSD